MTTKFCSKCQTEKDVSLFAKAKSRKDGLQTKCKQCDKEYREKNKDKIKSYISDYQYANRKDLLEKKRLYRLNNLEAAKARDKKWYLNNKEYVRMKSKEYWDTHKDRLLKSNHKRSTNRRKDDPIYAVRLRLSHRTRMALKGIGLTKSKSTFSMIGCSWQELKNHIESKFQPGMTWENRSAWHIDHIVPLASATTEQDVIRLNHYTNLQPLWAEDNLRKSDKLDFQL